MKEIVKCLVRLCVMFILVGASLWGQGSTAQISGTVKDTTGAVLPVAEVRATQTETAIARSTVSNETGAYVLPNLPIGPYRLEVSVPGLRTFALAAIGHEANSNAVINGPLDE